ncbi:COesterase domain-containing protein [Mycena indigotica]|uniref:COesterase domain-containing protein n=1 Tax=Mycena indigotica TaxID=2126181 RepID=A0A8H6VYI4_9AGAR|nr:COesterase domain-containing protein [Mycena indigotica]KAF7292839.1 COesterase domain-containing protein [Mycena indigotica]
MILDEKPPPPYSTNRAILTPPATGWRTFSALPPHLLLQIVYSTFSDAVDIAEQRKTLYWLSRGLRLVNRLLYTTSMNVLRSLYLPLYDSHIRRPYSSDPFPLTSVPHSHANSPLTSLQRETSTLDLFIALKVREDVWSDDSELHLERDDSFADLFNLSQPRSRLEDLFRDAAMEEGLVYIARQHRARTPTSSSADLRPETPPPYHDDFAVSGLACLVNPPFVHDVDDILVLWLFLLGLQEVQTSQARSPSPANESHHHATAVLRAINSVHLSHSRPAAFRAGPYHK